jgi:hypothetical protein
MDTVSVDAFGATVVSVLFLSTTEVEVVDGFETGGEATAEVALMLLDVVMIFPCHQGKITLCLLSAWVIQT